MANVVLLRETPSLADIPGQLRLLADQIEAGEHDDVASMFVLMPIANNFPQIWGWGDVSGENHPIVQLELAKAWFVNHSTGRA